MGTYDVAIPTLTKERIAENDLHAETLAQVMGGEGKPFSWSAPNPEAAAIADEYAALPLAERRARLDEYRRRIASATNA